MLPVLLNGTCISNQKIDCLIFISLYSLTQLCLQKLKVNTCDCHWQLSLPKWKELKLKWIYVITWISNFGLHHPVGVYVLNYFDMGVSGTFLFFVLSSVGWGGKETQPLFGLQLGRTSESDLLHKLWQLHRTSPLASASCEGVYRI